MALKLFRSTGYESILAPGETRAALHPGWLILAISAWVGFASNVVLWRELWAFPQGSGLVPAITLGVFVAAACVAVLSLLGWRKTLKPAATLILFVAALVACASWGQAPLIGASADAQLASLALPSWASFLRWQISALLVGLALVPTVWLWNTRVRRLPGPQQFNINALGLLAGGALLAGSGLVVFGGV